MGIYFDYLSLAAAFLLLSSLAIDWKPRIVRKLSSLLTEWFFERILKKFGKLIDKKKIIADENSRSFYTGKTTELNSLISSELEDIGNYTNDLISKTNMVFVFVSFSLFVCTVYFIYAYGLESKWLFEGGVYPLPWLEEKIIQDKIFFPWIVSSLMSTAVFLWYTFASWKKLDGVKALLVILWVLFVVLIFALNLLIYRLEWAFFLYPLLSYLSIMSISIGSYVFHVYLKAKKISSEY